MKARTTFCPHCRSEGRWSLIDLTPPYLCLVCGYSMIERRCIDYRTNIVMPLGRNMDKGQIAVFGTSSRVKILLDMRELGLVDLKGHLTPKGCELANR